MVSRSIVRIDEEKCTGCGLCIPACAEGALEIVDGKARLISDKYCDGLGACIGECPQGAIIIEEREAEEFNEEAAKEHVKKKPGPVVHQAHPKDHAYPSTKVLHFERNLAEKDPANIPEKRESMLSNWPVQLTLIPTNAPFINNTDLLITADCVPFAYANFHNDFLKDKTLIVGCPKLDDAESYKDKLTEIFKLSTIRNITVVNMEVPCCFGLYRLVKEAVDSSGKTIPINQAIISVKGKEHRSKKSRAHEEISP